MTSLQRAILIALAIEAAAALVILGVAWVVFR